MTNKPGARLTPDQRKEQILDAAARLLAEYGREGFNMSDLACSLGVTRPLLYHYYPNTQALLGAVVEREYARIYTLTALEDSATGRQRTSKEAIASFFEYTKNTPPALRALSFQVQLLPTRVQQTVREVCDALHRRTLEYLGIPATELKLTLCAG